MWKQKYDWEKIKIKFFESEFEHPSTFMRHTYGTSTAHIRRMTKWWSQDKEELKKKALNKAITQTEEVLAEYYKPTLDELWTMHKQIIQLSKAKINEMTNIAKNKQRGIKVNDIKVLWDIIKVEKNEPTSYVRSDNETLIKNDELSEEEKKAIDDLIDENF